jgi:tetratricopeptide (TPR) repeat protein
VTPSARSARGFQNYFFTGRTASVRAVSFAVLLDRNALSWPTPTSTRDATPNPKRSTAACSKCIGRFYGERHPLAAEDLINLGAIQQELAHYREAEEFDRRAWEITEAFYGKVHYKTASNLTLIARALVKQNRFDEAEALLQRALEIQERVFGKVHPRIASAVNELGSVALAGDRFDDAEIAFRRMLATSPCIKGNII